MKALEYVALFVCVTNILAFVGIWEVMISWGVIAIIPLTMIIYQRLKEKDENKI